MTEHVPTAPFETDEQADQQADQQADAVPEPISMREDQPTTGVSEVDRVVADLDGLDDLPLAEHLGAFERAHASLRAALDADPDAPA